MELHPYIIKGNWYRGWVLDRHTKSSKRVEADGHDTFLSTYTEIGRALHQWKYEGNLESFNSIATALEQQLRRPPKSVAAIIPIPPTKHRWDYTFSDLTFRLGMHWGIDAPNSYLTKTRDTGRIRDTEEASRRKALLGAFEVIDERYKGRDVLLFDDLYDTGSTLTEATKTLKRSGVVKVYVMALTRTRRYVLRKRRDA